MCFPSSCVWRITGEEEKIPQEARQEQGLKVCVPELLTAESSGDNSGLGV